MWRGERQCDSATHRQRSRRQPQRECGRGRQTGALTGGGGREGEQKKQKDGGSEGRRTGGREGEGKRKD